MRASIHTRFEGNEAADLLAMECADLEFTDLDTVYKTTTSFLKLGLTKSQTETEMEWRNLPSL